MSDSFTLEVDEPKLNRAIVALTEGLGIGVKEQLPYVSASIVKGAMNAEKIPKKSDVRNKSRSKAAHQIKVDFRSNDPGDFSKNIYLNTHKKFGKVNFVIKHGHTGKTYYPVYRDAQKQVQAGFSPSVERFIKDKIKEYNRVLKEQVSQGYKSMYMPKAVWFDMLIDFRLMGVDLNLISPQRWAGGRLNIENAVQAGGTTRIKNGRAWREQSIDISDQEVLVVQNNYPTQEKRKMRNRIVKSTNSYARKGIADLKHGVFENMEKKAAKYPWVILSN